MDLPEAHMSGSFDCYNYKFITLSRTDWMSTEIELVSFVKMTDDFRVLLTYYSNLFSMIAKVNPSEAIFSNLQQYGGLRTQARISRCL